MSCALSYENAKLLEDKRLTSFWRTRFALSTFWRPTFAESVVPRSDLRRPVFLRATVALAMVVLVSNSGCSKPPAPAPAAVPAPPVADQQQPAGAHAPVAQPAQPQPVANQNQQGGAIPGQPFVVGQPSAAGAPPGSPPAVDPRTNPAAAQNVPGGQAAATSDVPKESKFHVDFSRDGHFAISGGKNATIRLFDIDKGVMVRTFPGQDDPVSSVVFRQDGAVIAAGSVAGKIMVWDARTADGLDETERDSLGGEQRIPLAGHVGPIRSLAFRPDGMELVSGGEDGAIRFWKLPVSYPEVIWSPDSTVSRMIPIPESNIVVAGRSDGVVEIWQLLDTKTIPLLPETSSIVTALAVSAEGRFVAAGDAAGAIRVADLESGKQVFEQAAHEGQVSSLKFHPKRALLISIGSDGATRSFEIGPNSSNVNQTVLYTAQSKARLLSASHTGAYAAVASGNSIEVADLKNEKTLHTLSVEGGDIVSLAWTAEDKTLIAGTSAGDIYSWRIPGGQKLLEGRIAEGATRAIAGNSHDSKVVTGGTDGKIRIWNQPGLPETVAEIGKGEATTIATSTNGRRVAVGMADGSIRVIDTEKKGNPAVLPAAGKSVISLEFSPDGEWLAAASSGGLLRLWNLTQGAGSLATLETVAPATQVAFHASGPTLIAALQNGEFQKWKLPIQKSQTLSGHEETINAIVANDAGTQVFTAGNDRVCRQFNLATGEAVKSFEGAQDAVTSLVQSGDAKWLAAGDRSGQISMWSVDNAGLMASVQTIDGAVTGLDYLPAKRLLASSSIDGKIRLWRTPLGSPVHVADSAQESSILSISPNGKRLAHGRDDNSIIVRDSKTGDVLQTLSGHSGKITAIGWSIDSALVLSGSADQSVGLWRVSDGQRIVKWDGHTVPIKAVAISANGEELRACADNGRLLAFTRATTAERELLPAQGAISALEISPSGKRLALANSDGAVKLVNCETGAEFGSTPATEPIVALAWCADDVTWITLDANRNVKYWTQLTADANRGWTNGPKGVTKFCASADGTHLLTSTDEGPPKLWDSQGRLLQTLPWNTKTNIQAIALSDDGQLAAAVGADGSTTIYPSLPVLAIAAHTGHADVVQFASDDSIVSAGDDKTIRATSIVDGKEIRNFDGCPAKVVELIASSPSSKVVALADDKKIYAWDLGSGTLLDLPPEFANRTFRRIGLNADKLRLAALDEQGKFQILDLEGLKSAGEATSPTADASAVVYLKDGTIVSAAEALGYVVRGNSAKAGSQAHEGAIIGVAASPNRDEFLTAGEDGKVKVWSLSGEFVRDLTESDSPILSVSINSAGKEVVVVCKDSKAKIYEYEGEAKGEVAIGNRPKSVEYSGNSLVTTTESQVRIFHSAKAKPVLTLNAIGKFTAASLSGDRRAIYAATNEGNLVRYGIEPQRTINSEQREVTSLAMSKNAASVVSGGEDASVCVWKLATGKQSAKLKGHTKPITAVTFGRDEAFVASAGADKNMCFWKVTATKPLQTISLTSAAQTLSVSNDGKNLVAATKEKAATVYDIQSGKPNQSVSTDSSSILSAQYGSKGLMTLDADKQVCTFDSTVAKQFPKQEGALSGLDVLRDGSFFVIAGVKTGVKLLDYNGKLVGEFDTSKLHAEAVSVSADGLWLAGFDNDGADSQALTIWNVATRKTALTIKTPSKIRSALFEPDGTKLVVVGEDKQLRRYRALDGEFLESIPMSDDLKAELQFYNPGEILSLERDDRLRLYQPSLVRMEKAHQGPVTALTYSSNGNLVFSGGADGRVVGWDEQSSSPAADYAVEGASVTGVQMLASQESVIAAYSDNKVRVWQLKRKSPTPESEFVHKAPVKCLWTSADSSMMATGGSDKLVHLWIIGLGREVAQFRGHEGAVSKVVIAPDNKSIVSFGDEDSIRVWKVPDDVKTAGTMGQIDRSTGTVVMAQPQDIEIDRLMKSLQASGTTTRNVEDVRKLELLRSGRSASEAPGAQADAGAKKIDREIQSLEKRIRNAVGQNKKKLRHELTLLKLQRQITNSSGSKQDAAKKEYDDYQSGRNPNPIIDLELERPPGIDPALRSIRTDFIFDAQVSRPIKLALSPDKNSIAVVRESAVGATGPIPGTVQIWDRESGSLLRSWKENQLPKVSAIEFSSDERAVLTYPDAFAFQIQNGSSQALSSNACIAISPVPGANLLAIGLASTAKTQAPVLKFLETRDMSFRPQMITGFEAKITAMTFSPDGKSLFYCERGSRQHKLFELNVENTSSTTLIEEAEHTESWQRMASDGLGIEALCVSRDGKNLLGYGQYNGADYRITCWTRNGDKWVVNSKFKIQAQQPILRSADSSRMWTMKERPGILCVEDAKGQVQTLEISTAKPVATKQTKPTRFGKPETAHSEDGAWFVWGDDTGKLEVWDLRENKPNAKTIKAHSGPIVGVAISSDGSGAGDFIVSLGEENLLKVWELPKKGEPSKKPRGK